MTDLVHSFARYLPYRLGTLPWRAHPLDGKLLLFDRSTGLNVLLEGDETQHLRRVAPRTLLIAVTNACNLTCDFCYRNVHSHSTWRYDTLLEFCQAADKWGVLEVAFGGGEPMLFPRWQDFICQLYETTGLGISFTTNGTLLTEDFLCGINGWYGQIRVSLYEDNDWPEIVALLSRCKARFGINWLITPEELKTVESKFSRLVTLGVRDFLLLSYKGNALPEMHLAGPDRRRLAAFVNRMHACLGHTVQIKLDICWGNHLSEVPRLFTSSDCEAGDDFLSITSDKGVKPCSFQQTTVQFETLDDVRAYWERWRTVRQAATLLGCARLPDHGLTEGGLSQNAVIHLATIQ